MPAKAWRRPRIRWRASPRSKRLRAGGTAADAAVTAVALLSVIEPQMTGIGGDCFCLVAKPGAPVWGYNGSGRTGAAMNIDALLAQGLTGSIPQDSIHAVTVPGAVDAWEAILKTHGRFGLDRALAPAIRTAEEGYAVPPRVAFDWSLAAERLRKDKGATLHYLPGGQPPAVGDIVKLPALAATLKTIANRRFARILRHRHCAGHRRHHRAARQHARRVGFRRASRRGSRCRSRRIIAVSTSSNCRRTGRASPRLCCSTFSNASTWRRSIRTAPSARIFRWKPARLAYAVRDTHIADPAFMRMAVPRLLDRDFAADLADKIDRTQALGSAAGAGSARRYDARHRGRSRPQRGLDHQFAVRRRSVRRSRPRKPASCCIIAA